VACRTPVVLTVACMIPVDRIPVELTVACSIPVQLTVACRIPVKLTLILKPKLVMKDSNLVTRGCHYHKPPSARRKLF